MKTPTHCPHCGASGENDTSFGPLGYKKETRYIRRAGDGENETYLLTWFRYHCPQCGNVTAMLESEEPFNGDKEP